LEEARNVTRVNSRHTHIPKSGLRFTFFVKLEATESEAMTDKNQEITELAEYDSDEDAVEFPDNDKDDDNKNSSKASTARSGTHIAVHSSGFKDFLLRPEIMRAIADAGFEHPSTVQSECIPQAILGTDVLCQAKSGMGKTAVFVLSVLQQISPEDSDDSTICLVLVHTRELAFQIRQEFERFKRHMPNIRTKVLYGGIPVPVDKKELRESTPHIVIGTPGRTLHLATEGALKLNRVKHFILDECDKMLENLDMRRDVQKIFMETPHDKQVMMFSATMPNDVKQVAKRFMHNPHEIFINDGSKLTLFGLQQYYLKLEEKEKNRKLIDLLDVLDFNQVVIFVNAVNRADMLNKLLNDENFPSICSYGRLEHDARIETYNKFKKFESRIMVATNLLGRGVDFERVNLVVNYDMAASEDEYLHRVGRAGRFGTKGLAISFIATDKDREILEKVRSKFVVDLPELPERIDSATYMNS